MGICYMLQYMDKLALSQATLLNIRSDLVSDIEKHVLSGHQPFSHAAPGWPGIYLVLCDLLFWLSRVEWTHVVFDHSPSPGQIPGCFCVCLPNN